MPAHPLIPVNQPTVENNLMSRRLAINILRGGNQIGGNLIQVTCDSTSILLDAGETLEGDHCIPPKAAYLVAPGGYDAIFLSTPTGTTWVWRIRPTRLFPFTWGAGPMRY